ncbi:MAG: hypothetical protein MUC29_05655 [Pyrinomonadaceae bacterium]|jgi:uncharacterized membrane protein HdeD (DUF308 family)|nr:hypothetical protein [Pyrinomonadaceae bacterium]
MKDMLFAILGLISVIIGVWQIYTFTSQGKDSSSTPLIIGVICVVIAVIFGILFMVGRVNKTEDIHVTE